MTRIFAKAPKDASTNELERFIDTQVGEIMVDEPFIVGDFRFAVIQAICLLHEGIYHLVFASAELLPAELPRPPDEPCVRSEPARRLGSQTRLFHQRYVVSAEEALSWYRNCREGRFTLLADDVLRNTAHEPLVQEPAWPQLVTSSNFPVWGDTLTSPRAHHLYPAATPQVVERMFQLHPEMVGWVSDRVFVPFLRYPELVGSVHLLVPNPVYRESIIRLHVDEDGAESGVVEVTPRAGMTAEGLEVLVFEHRPTGISWVYNQRFGAQPHMMVPFHGTVQETEVFIHCPRRGLLEWQEASSFVRAFSLNGSLVGTRKRVTVPSSVGQPSETYEVEMVDQGFTSEYRSDRLPSEIPARLRASERERVRNDEAKRLGQQWFHGTRQDATEFVRGLIGNARERVWIVDPYFATVELFSFALATSRSDVEVKILTGAEALRKPEMLVPSTEAGDVLFNTTNGRADMAHIQILVMMGDQPTVHDRFLVIDQTVWFTGNSLNSLGERAGMMISLPAPDVVIEKLDAIMVDAVRTKPLAEWVAERRASRAA